MFFDTSGLVLVTSFTTLLMSCNNSSFNKFLPPTVNNSSELRELICEITTSTISGLNYVTIAAIVGSLLLIEKDNFINFSFPLESVKFKTKSAISALKESPFSDDSSFLTSS